MLVPDGLAMAVENLPAQTDDHPAYILYTSGSTGRPKGVIVSKAAFANYCDWAAKFYCAGKQLTFALFTSIGFDLTVTSLFVPLMTGGQVRIYPEALSAAELSVIDVVKENKADIVKLTPAHLTLLQDQDCSQSRIQQFVVGGEDFKTALARHMQQALGKGLLQHNEYGPTEATVGCIVHTYDQHQDTGESVPIGFPVAGMTALLLNEHLCEQPDGVIGELYLTGPSLADGYWRQPDLSTERFVPNPFCPPI